MVMTFNRKFEEVDDISNPINRLSIALFYQGKRDYEAAVRIAKGKESLGVSDRQDIITAQRLEESSIEDMVTFYRDLIDSSIQKERGATKSKPRNPA